MKKEKNNRSYGKYIIKKTLLDYIIVGIVENDIVFVALADNKDDLTSSLFKKNPNIDFIEDDGDLLLTTYIKDIEKYLIGEFNTINNLPIKLNGTDLQKSVWNALKNISLGTTKTYKDIAIELNRATSMRAIANACGANPIALLIPCHRVIRSNGDIAGYRWGIERKRYLLNLEKKYNV